MGIYKLTIKKMSQEPEEYQKLDKEIEDLGLESGAFESLEREFQEVMKEMMKDKALERFRLEYEKLHRALKTSHESEKRLIKKCKELNQEIINNAAKVQTALKLSKEDAHTISILKREVDKIYKLVELSRDKEDKAKQTIQSLKMEISHLGKIVEQGSGLSIGQDNTVNELLRVKEELTKYRDLQNSTIIQLRAD